MVYLLPLVTALLWRLDLFPVKIQQMVNRAVENVLFIISYSGNKTFLYEKENYFYGCTLL